MTSSTRLVIKWDELEIDLSDGWEDVVSVCEDFGIPVCWDYNGLVHEIPPAVLRNALDRLHEFAARRDDWRAVEGYEIGIIKWSDLASEPG